RQVQPRTLLVDFLREDIGLVGTHVSCALGACGVWTILLGGRPTRACLVLAVQASGHDLVTVEGLAHESIRHPLQQAFMESRAVQCGFCTPGMLISAYSLLSRDPNPPEADIRLALSDVICRCGGYDNIVSAVMSAREAS